MQEGYSSSGNYKSEVVDQGLRKGMSGDPLLVVNVKILGKYKDKYGDPSKGIDVEPTEKVVPIFLDFSPAKLSKTVEYLEAIGVRGATASSFHPANKQAVSLVGKTLTVWDSKNEASGKTSWRISKFKPRNVEIPTLDEVAEFDQLNEGAYSTEAPF